MTYKVKFRIIGDKPPFTVTLHEDNISEPAVITKTTTSSNIIDYIEDTQEYTISPFKQYCLKVKDSLNKDVEVCDIIYPIFNLTVLTNQSSLNVNYLNINENILNNKTYNIPVGENIVLNATPPQGYSFKNWETIPVNNLNNSSNNPLNFVMLNTNFAIKPINEETSNSFIFTIDTTKGTGNSMDLPLRNGFDYDFVVNWGDNTSSIVTSFDDITKSHTYTSGGVYQIKITGLCETIHFLTNNNDSSKLISIDQWGNTGFINMEQAFFSCNNLTSVYDNNSNWSTNVTSMNGMFYQCGNLSYINLNNWDVSNVLNMGGLFYRCGKLTNLDLSNWNVSSVINMGGMFYECVLLENLNLNTWNTSNVTNMVGMFNGCSQLNVVGLNNWNIQNVQYMANILNGVILDTNYYDSIIIAWATQTVQNNVIFDANLSKRSVDSCDAYNTLVDTYNWNITDNTATYMCRANLDITYNNSETKVLYSVTIPYEGTNANIEITPSGGGTTQIIPIIVENYYSSGEYTMVLSSGLYDASVVAHNKVYFQRPLTVY